MASGIPFAIGPLNQSDVTHSKHVCVRPSLSLRTPQVLLRTLTTLAECALGIPLHIIVLCLQLAELVIIG